MELAQILLLATFAIPLLAALVLWLLGATGLRSLQRPLSVLAALVTVAAGSALVGSVCFGGATPQIDAGRWLTIPGPQA